METRHRVTVGDSRDMAAVADDSVHLVVTSPPYPMIEMWDGVFADLDPEIGEALEAGAGDEAFERMHTLLDATWREVDRVLVDGGIACVNVGDATRTVDGSFACYPNHVRITERFMDHGFRPLPDIVWRKPTNSPTKYLGSGTLPPNAYVTLEHESILVFRKGDPRSFEPGCARRYESAFFWEERNRWFSDLWTDVVGEDQSLPAAGPEQRSGAFPFAIPYRLINMYSVYGDTVLDPFAGTGTTMLAAMASARESIGYELDGGLVDVFDNRVGDVSTVTAETIRDRLDRHAAFVEEYERENGPLPYEASTLGVPVRTKQERDIRFYGIDAVTEGASEYVVTHSPLEGRK